MRITLINHEYPPFGGGAATITRELFNRLSITRHDVFLLTANIHQSDKHIVKLNTCRKKNSQGSAIEFIRFLFAGLYNWKKVRNKCQPDINFAFFTFPGGMLAFCYKILFRTPYIVSIRGGDIPGFQLGKKLDFFQKLAKPLIRLICRNAILVHVNSNRLYQLAIATGINDTKLKYLPNGINISTKNKIPRENIQKVKLLFTGRLSKQKNLDTFIRGLALVEEDFSMYIIGDGEEKEDLQKLVRNSGLDSQIVFHDWTNREQLTDLYNQYNVIVLPSLDEGMSNSALEAVSMGCALLSSKNAHLQWDDKEIMKNWVVNDYLNPIAWKQYLENIIINKDAINSTTKKMQQFIKENNDWNILFEKYLTMIEACVE